MSFPLFGPLQTRLQSHLVLFVLVKLHLSFFLGSRPLFDQKRHLLGLVCRLGKLLHQGFVVLSFILQLLGQQASLLPVVLHSLLDQLDVAFKSFILLNKGLVLQRNLFRRAHQVCLLSSQPQNGRLLQILRSLQLFLFVRNLFLLRFQSAFKLQNPFFVQADLLLHLFGHFVVHFFLVPSLTRNPDSSLFSPVCFQRHKDFLHFIHTCVLVDKRTKYQLKFLPGQFALSSLYLVFGSDCFFLDCTEDLEFHKPVCKFCGFKAAQPRGEKLGF